MRPGYELVKEQIFFRKELRERVYWFIKIRWAFASMSLLGLAAATFMDVRLPVFSLTLICIAALVYNAVFARIAGWLERRDPSDDRPYTIFAHVQFS
ncbi:MAG: hypothetical protein AAGU11_17915, partial [Syntrophobacteraceae bacterium]